MASFFCLCVVDFPSHTIQLPLLMWNCVTCGDGSRIKVRNWSEVK